MQPEFSSAPGAVGPSAPAARPKGPLLLVTILAALTLLMAFVSNGDVALTLAPTLGFLVAYVFVKVPLRYPWLIYITLVLLLDTPAEPFVSGKFKSPFYPLALVLSGQLKNVIPSGALVMSGLNVFLLVTLILHAVRRAQHSPLDREGYLRVPFPLMVACWLALGGILVATIYGLATGGSSRFVMWQVQRNIYLPLVFLMVQAVFPNPSQYRTYAKILVVVACFRAVFAIILRHYFPLEEYTSSHSDSMLFGTVTCFLVLRWLHQPTRREVFLGVPILGLLTWGMIANDRRMVWVELVLACAAILWITPRNRFKVRLLQFALASLPFVLIYIAAGWKSNSAIFAPVATIRSMVDSKSDGSTLWRDLENFNLVSTFAGNPMMGRGFGHPYDMAIVMPDITDKYELEPYLPHNSIVGVWAFTGYLGFSLIWLVPLAGLYMAARAYLHATDPFDRTAALTCASLIIIYNLQCYGDMGLGSPISVMLLAPSIALIGKLAVKVGAWPA